MATFEKLLWDLPQATYLARVNRKFVCAYQPVSAPSRHPMPGLQPVLSNKRLFSLREVGGQNTAETGLGWCSCWARGPEAGAPLLYRYNYYSPVSR